MCMTYYTVDDLRPGRPGWDVRQFSALAEAIDHYRALPMNGGRVLGMADDAHAYELIRCVRLFPGKAPPDPFSPWRQRQSSASAWAVPTLPPYGSGSAAHA